MRAVVALLRDSSTDKNDVEDLEPEDRIHPFLPERALCVGRIFLVRIFVLGFLGFLRGARRDWLSIDRGGSGGAMLIHIYEMTRGGLWGVLAAAILIAKHVACGCYASRWLVRDLKERGYSCVG